MDNPSTIAEKAWSYFDNKSKYKSKANREVILVANNLDTPENVGGLIRSAGNVGCVKVIFTGDESKFKKTKIRRTSTNAFDKVSWIFCEEKDWPSLIPEGYTKIAIETVPEATDVYATELPDKVAFIVGNESYGITDWTLSQCDSSIFIPMPGPVKSLNVNQAGTLVLFEWWRRDYIIEND